MRLSSRYGVALLLGLLASCYEQPALSPQSPLRCNPAGDKGECPSGYLCTPLSVCAPTTCRADSECPLGLACVSRLCAISVDGGARDGGAGDLLIPPGGFDGGGVGPDAAVNGSADGPVSLPDATILVSPDGGLD